MKDFGKIIIPIIIIIIVLLTVLLFLLIYNHKNQTENIVDNEIISGDLYNYEEAKEELLTDDISFYTISKCVSEYLNKLNKNNGAYYGTDDNGKYIRILNDDAIAQTIIDILDKDYINKNQITTSNVFNFTEKITKQVIFVPLKINILPGRNTEKYAIYGFIQDIDNNFIKELYIIATLDVKNNTYSIEPLLNNTYKDVD